MKKLICVILTAVLALSLCVPAFAAAGSTISGKTKIAAGETFTVTLSVTGVSEISALNAMLSYDTSKVTLNREASSGLNNFNLTFSTNGDKIVLDTSSPKSGTVAFAKLSFTATSSFAEGQSTQIAITSGKVADSLAETSFSGCSLTVKVVSTNNNLASLSVNGNALAGFSPTTTSYNLGNTDASSITVAASAASASASVSGAGTKNLAYGKNTIKVVVTAENGSKKTYSLIITRNDNRSTDSKLKSLSVSPGSLEFSAGRTSYTIILDNSVTSITVSATANDSKAKVSGTGKKNLAVYSNIIKVVVTAENGSKTTYSLTVVRKDAQGNLGKLSDDNELSSLTIEGYELAFDAKTTEYTLTVDNTVSSVNVSAQASDENAAVEISAPDPLAQGENAVTVSVTSQSQKNKVYTITVTRSTESPETDLDGLLETIEKAASDTVILREGNDGNLPSDMISALKRSGKTLNVIKYADDGLPLYIWSINGASITDEDRFNSKLDFSSELSANIDAATNYARAIKLHFSHTGALPENTSIKIYVADEYPDGSLLNLYRFDPDTSKITLVREALNVTDGYVETDIDHCSDYFLSQTVLSSGADVYFYAALALAILFAVTTVVLLIKNKKLKTALRADATDFPQ